MRRGIRVIGTLRVLFDAAAVELCDLSKAYDQLQQTSFRTSAKVMTRFLELDSIRKASKQL